VVAGPTLGQVAAATTSRRATPENRPEAKARHLPRCASSMSQLFLDVIPRCRFCGKTRLQGRVSSAMRVKREEFQPRPVYCSSRNEKLTLLKTFMKTKACETEGDRVPVLFLQHPFKNGLEAP
jgi:hypothetical protein